MSKVYIVRHGNTFDPGDIVTRVGARTDLALSESGKAQAKALGTYFEAKKFKFQTAACSPLRRTRETAKAILGATDSPAQLRVETFLTELDYGPDENKPESEVIARIGEPAIREWDETARLPDGWHLDVGALCEAWRNYFSAARSAPSPALIVTSNGVARFLFKALDLATVGHDIKLKTGAFGHLRFEDNEWKLEQWNVRP